MDQIIAGRFQTKSDADAAAALMAPYVDSADICIFHNNPPGQHDRFAVGGDEDEDPAAKGADKSAAGTAIAAGLSAGAVGALAGPVVALAAAATGAYLGSLAGAMHGLEDKEGPPQRRPSGVILSVRIATPINQKRVIATLRAQGAADIEQADGEWLDGDWTDFDPVAAPRLVESVN
jgi:S-formylglutathione hydrolase FrmB